MSASNHTDQPVPKTPSPLPARRDRTLDLPTPLQLILLADRLLRLILEYGNLYRKSLLEEFDKIAVRAPIAEVDAFGMDSGFRQRMFPLADFLFNKYFRVEAIGLDHIPAKGRICLVANHSGVLPYDAMMISHAVMHQKRNGRLIRSLLDDQFVNTAFLSTIITRMGSVRACQENAQRLLMDEQAICIFPEGIQGVMKHYKHRYQLKRFGRGGFVNLCLRTKTPIIPVVVIGAEEVHPVLYRNSWLRRRVGTLVPPITPTFPALGPLGLLPMPSKWTIEFGKPIDVSREFNIKDEDDELGVNLAKEKIRARIQGMIYQRLKTRKGVWIG